jgi:tellurite methyltransferase
MPAMLPSEPSRSVKFFEEQFQRQIAAADYALNPFETLALPYLRGRALDLGCGLGNLSLAAARAGASVMALDACANAVADLNERARQAGLDVTASATDLQGWRPTERFDTVACIGLLMFFERSVALRGLRTLQEAVKPGGVVIVNVLAEGTTFSDMFDPRGYHLFSREELLVPFIAWTHLLLRGDRFPAPGGTVKCFLTLAARRP